MTVKRIFIALFLAFTYSIGLGHNVVPHCHDVMSGDLLLTEHNHNHQHDHHQHSDQNETQSHDHIQHDDHFDDNIFDLLVCYISDDIHSTDACYTDQDYTPEPNQKNNNFATPYPAILSDIDNTNGVFFVDISVRFIDNRESFSTYDADRSQTLRGPPTA